MCTLEYIRKEKETEVGGVGIKKERENRREVKEGRRDGKEDRREGKEGKEERGGEGW